MRASIIFLLLACTTIAACSSSSTLLTRTKSLVIYPQPPDTTRIQYLGSFSQSTDVTGDKSWLAGLAELIVGREGAVPIEKPYGLTIASGRVHICDTKTNSIEVIDLSNRTFDVFAPDGLGQLKKPINCFVDTSGMLYVADVERRQIVVFDRNGALVHAFGDANDGKPTDVCVSGGKIFVADIKKHAVEVYNKDDYSYLYSIPKEGVEMDGILYSPTNICVTPDRVFVSDIGGYGIKEYTLDGELVRSYGSGAGDNPGHFSRPKGLAVDHEGNVYVVDAGFENVQIFDSGGNLLMHFGGEYKGPGDMWLPAKVVIDYDNVRYFQHLVDPQFTLKYLIFVTNQYGPDKISVYGFVGPSSGEEGTLER